MPTRATPSPVDPARVTEAVRQISTENSPWAIPAEISPEGVVPGYPEYSTPVPTPRANPVRVSQTPELGFTPGQPSPPDVNPTEMPPTIGPADYWTGKPEQPAQQYYDQDLKPLREPDAVIGPAADMAAPPTNPELASVDDFRDAPIAGDVTTVNPVQQGTPARSIPYDPARYTPSFVSPAQSSATAAQVADATARLSNQLSAGSSQQQFAGTKMGASTQSGGLRQAASVPTPPSRPAFGSAPIPTPRARPALAADAAPSGVRTGTFGGDMIGYNRATTSKSSSIGDTGLQAAQEAKAFADARQKANEAMGIGPVTDAQYASGRLSNAYANNARSKTQETPAGTRLAGYDKVSNVGYQTGKPVSSSYSQKMAELDAEDLSSGTMTPDDLAQLEAMRPQDATALAAAAVSQPAQAMNLLSQVARTDPQAAGEIINMANGVAGLAGSGGKMSKRNATYSNNQGSGRPGSATNSQTAYDSKGRVTGRSYTDSKGRQHSTTVIGGREYTNIDGKSGAGSGGGSKKVLCTHYKNKGWLPREIWARDGKAALKRSFDETTFSGIAMAGYQLWAKPVVTRMERGDRVSRVLELAFWPIIKAWAYESAGHRSVAGKVSRLILEPPSYVIGLAMRLLNKGKWGMTTP